MPAIVDETTWIPELDREDLLYHRLFLAEKWLVLKLRYGHADPRDAGVGNIVNCGAAMYIAPVGIANAGDPDGARTPRRSTSPPRTSRATAGRRRACWRPPWPRRCRPDATVDSVVETCAAACQGRHADGDRGGRRRGCEARRLARRRPRRAAAGVRAVRLGRRALRRAGPERAHPEPAARDRGAADRARAARRDGRRLRGDRARRRQLRPRLRLDRVDGRRARGRARRSERFAATGSTRSRPRARSTSRTAGRRMAASPSEIFALGPRSATRSGRGRWPPSPPARCLLEGDLDPAGGSRRARAPAGSGGGQGRRRRSRSAGSRPAARPRPPRGASPGAGRRPSCGRSRSSCSTSSPRCRARSRQREPEGFDEILAAADPVAPADAERPARRGSRARGSAARPAACSASRSRTSRARASARSREATGNWPVRGVVHGRGRAGRGARSAGRGTAPAARRASPRTSTGSPRTTTSTSRCSALRCSSAAAPTSTRSTSRRSGSTTCRRGGSSPPSASRAQPARGVPAARDGDAAQPVPRVDRRAAARRRVRLGRRRRPGRARRGWRGRTRASATRRTASTRRCSWPRRTRRRSRRSSPAACADAGLSVVPGDSRLAEALRDARELGRQIDWEEVVDELYARYGRYHWVHAINNTALVAAALYAFDGDFSGRDLRRSCRAAGTRTRTAPRSARSLGAIVGPGGIDERWSAPLGGRFASSLPGFDGITIDELARRTLAVAGARRSSRELPLESAARPARRRGRSTCRRPCRSTRTPTSAPLDGAKIFAAPDDPADWPAWREALARWRDEARGADRLRRRAPTSAGLAWTQSCFAVALVWLWDELLYDHAAGRFTPDRLCAEAEREFGGFDGIVLWHAYPVIGIDERNQFDYYRDVPGICASSWPSCRGAASASSSTTTRGTSARGASRSPTMSRSRELVRELGVDGVFLDTMKEAQPGLRAALDGVRPGSRSRASRRCRSRASATTTSRGRSGSRTADVPGVLRARWFEQRHMLHHTRRWNRSHTEELHSAWLNGVGILVWENVFGAWVGWNERDQGLLRAMRPVQRRVRRPAGDAASGRRSPRRAPDTRVVASRWSDGETTLWTLANRGGDVRGAGRRARGRDPGAGDRCVPRRRRAGGRRRRRPDLPRA